MYKERKDMYLAICTIANPKILWPYSMHACIHYGQLYE